MRKIFKVELSGPGCQCSTLDLPATPYAMLDILEQLRAADGDPPTWDILEVHACGNIAPYLDYSGSLPELNALCQRLAVLNEKELAVVEGLAKASCAGPSTRVPMPRLIDMAYSTDCCHLAADAADDYSLGRFAAENGFVPEADNLSDKAFELLDFTRIGREFREAEGGALTPWGYVQKHDELRQVYESLDLAPNTPDYAVLVKTASGAQIKLPRPLDDPAGDEPAQCVDCAAPALIGLTGTVGTWDTLAHRLTYLTVDGEMPKYKAVLEATECADPVQALALADELDQYAFSPRITEYEDVARERLAAGLSSEDVALLLPRLNLHGFGRDLVEHSGGQLTGYGLVERGGVEQKQAPAQNGMEM